MMGLLGLCPIKPENNEKTPQTKGHKFKPNLYTAQTYQVSYGVHQSRLRIAVPSSLAF